MKITIEIQFPKNASQVGLALVKARIAEEIGNILIAIGNATVPELEPRIGDTQVDVKLS